MHNLRICEFGREKYLRIIYLVIIIPFYVNFILCNYILCIGFVVVVFQTYLHSDASVELTRSSAVI